MSDASWIGMNKPEQSPAAPSRALSRFALPSVLVLLGILAVIMLARIGATLDRLQSQVDAGAAATAERDDRARDFSAVYTGEHQAVFLANNQVYFCRVHSLPGEYLLCEDAFYLKVQDQTGKTAEQQLNLTRLGQSELHQPEAALKIPLTSVLFVEDIRPDAEILKAIAGFDRGTESTPTAPAQ